MDQTTRSQNDDPQLVTSVDPPSPSYSMIEKLKKNEAEQMKNRQSINNIKDQLILFKQHNKHIERELERILLLQQQGGGDNRIKPTTSSNECSEAVCQITKSPREVDLKKRLDEVESEKCKLEVRISELESANAQLDNRVKRFAKKYKDKIAQLQHEHDDEMARLKEEVNKAVTTMENLYDSFKKIEEARRQRKGTQVHIEKMGDGFKEWQDFVSKNNLKVDVKIYKRTPDKLKSSH